MSLESKPKKRLVGYARVSSRGQDLTRQIAVRGVGKDVYPRNFRVNLV